jgi:hypothetical protein
VIGVVTVFAFEIQADFALRANFFLTVAIRHKTKIFVIFGLVTTIASLEKLNKRFAFH